MGNCIASIIVQSGSLCISKHVILWLTLELRVRAVTVSGGGGDLYV